MSFGDRNEEKDEFWDLDKLIPKKKTATLSPFASRPTVSDYTSPVPSADSSAADKAKDSSEERKLTIDCQKASDGLSERVYYPENTLIKRITVKKYAEKYDFYDSFRKAAVLYFDCPGEKCDFAQFYSYMPQYSQLNKAQKSYYFYWRSEMRKGRFIKTDYSYLYLYVYEIINLPDLVMPTDGIRLLCRVWREYRKALPRIDMYFSIWVRDYCLVHELPCPIAEIRDFIFDVIRISDFKEYYFTDIGTTNRDGVWSLIAYLSDYDWHKGFVSITGTSSDESELMHRREIYKTLLEGAIRTVLPNVWDVCMREKESGNLVRIQRAAFANTLCTHSVKCRLEIEYYPLAESAELRAGITAAVRYTENKLRALFGTKSRLAVKYIPKEYKDLIDCYFDELITKTEREAKRRNAPEYERLYDAPREKLSFEGADEIERLSWDTTMRLCDTEDLEDTERDEPYTPVENSAPVEEVTVTETNDYGLTESEIAYISTLLESGEHSIHGFEEEAVVERINEAFSDGFGDVIIENNGEGFVIIEDYKEEVEEWLKNL